VQICQSSSISVHDSAHEQLTVYVHAVCVCVCKFMGTYALGKLGHTGPSVGFNVRLSDSERSVLLEYLGYMCAPDAWDV
jgi:hypothetical protein